MVDGRLDANKIKLELEFLIKRAKLIDPKLAERLRELNNWIKEKSPGKLRQKKYVCDFLTEIIVDAGVWLNLQSATQEVQQEAFESMSTSERFWYEELFPRWLNERDPKLHTWKKQLMGEGTNREDDEFLGGVQNEIEKYGGNTLRNYILDFSMATDILVCGRFAKPLCTQLTTVNPKHTEDKIFHWKLTLCHWSIKRGLFVSYNPMGCYGDHANLSQFILQKGDEFEIDGYVVHNL